MDTQKHNDVKRFIQRSCLSKKDLTKEKADDIVDRAAMYEGLTLYYYKCNFCNSFHMTGNPPNDAHLRYEVI